MLVKLKDLLTIKNGSDYKRLSPGDIPVIGTGGIMLYVNKFLYDKEAILLPRKGSLNNIMYVDKPFWTVDTMFYAIPNQKKVNAKYLYYHLSLIDFSRLDVGSTIPSMTASLYYSLTIDLPTLEVQNKIANALSTIDSQIKRNEAMVKRLQVLAQTIFYKFYGDNIKNFNGILSDLCSLPSGYSFKPSNYVENGKYKLITIKNVNGSFVDTKNVDTINDIPNNMKSFCYLNIGDILVSLTGNVGRISINSSLNCLLNQRVSKLIFKDNKYRLYVYLLLNSEYYQEKMKQMANGTSQKNLSPLDVEKLRIFIPDNIDEFYKFTKDILNQLCLLNLSSTNLNSLKINLLPLLINGQIQ